MYMKTFLFKIRHLKINNKTALRRIVSFLLCICISATMLCNLGGWMVSSAAESTQNVMNRIADEDTTDTYQDKLLSSDWGSRYAGRVWTDKSVFANGTPINLDMGTDGYAGSVKFDSDFGTVFSALASSQVVNEWPPAPIDLVIAIDMSASMAQDTRCPINDLNTSTTDNSYTQTLEPKERTMVKRIENSRIQKTLDAVNETIDMLMKQNKENRVSVVVYGAGAAVVMPLAHYARVSGNEPYLSVGGMETLYTLDDLTNDPTYGWVWTRNIDACYTVVAKAMRSDDDNPTFAGEPFTNTVSNNVDNNSKPKSAEVDGTIYTEKVIANPGYADWDGVNPETAVFSPAQKELNADTYVGYFTNTQGGIYLAYAQLARSEKTTFTAKMSTGEDVTVARIPAAIIMSDGGANFAFNEMDYWSLNYGDFGSVRYKNEYTTDSPYYRRSNTGKTYLENGEEKWDGTDKSHNLGEDGMQKGDEWYNVYLPGVGDGNKITSLYNTGALATTDGTLLSGGNTLSTSPAWSYAGIFYSTDGSPFGTSGTVLETLLTAAYMRHVTKTHYENGWDAGSATKESRSDLLTYTMSVDSQNVPQWGRMRLYPSLDPATYSLDSEQPWWTDDDKFGTDEGIGNGYTKDAIYQGMLLSWQNWKNGSRTQAQFVEQRGYIDPLPTDGYTDSRFDNIKVTNQDVINNISYADDFYDIDAGEVVAKFQEILSEITGNVFVPISGDNDAGVGDSITYQDPLGEYMELKNQAIHATVHDNTKEGTYDMALLVFGKMHGLVRAGTYDWQWNDDYMEAHPDVGTQGEKPFPMGWYWGDDPKTAHTAEELGVDVKNAADGTGTYPAENPETHEPYDNAEQAWADGWVYRFNLSTMLQFVPLNADIESSVHPADAPEQIKNTVYTCYRFAGSKTARNQLYRNPVYGDVPAELKKIWDEHVKTGDYPVGMDEYSEYPGVYRLSDIRVWAEHTGDFIDQTGSLTPEEQSGYDDSLYVNIPTAAVPTQLAEITLGPNGPISYKDNLDQKTQSTPFRLFYAVGLTEDLILRDAKNNQTGVDVSKISGEYIATHSDPKTNNIYFISNWYSNTVYRGYASDESSYGYSTRGDAAVSFSPSVENRYYLFQKPLPLIAHAYRVLNEGGDVAPVDNADNKKWGANGSGNSTTNWEKGETGATWSGGDFIGTYDNQTSFKNALEGKKKIIEDSDIWYITDAKGYSYPLPANINDAIITYTKDQLSKVDSDADGYTDDSNSFSSDDYFFLCIEYYLPMGGTGTDIDGKEVPGTQAVRKINRMIARKGSAFGSGLASNNINNGDMLCWTDIKGNCNLEIEYNSRTDTGDNTRGRPTLEKLTYSENALRTYLSNNGLYDTGTVTWTEGETEKTGTPLDRDVAYWMKLREDPHMAALIEQITAPGVNSQEKFDELFDWSVAARTGGIRVGDMYNNVQPKGGSTDIEVGSDQYYAGNLTHTANNYYVPTLSETSTAGNGMVINNYLGNNGRMEIANTNLIVTKMLVAPDGFTLTEDQENEDFDYQVYVQGVTGERLAQRLKWNPFSQSWQKRVESLDILTDNSSLLLDTNGKRALFCYQSGEPRQVVEVVEDGETKYYYADESGAATKDECTEGLENLYYMYLPSNASGDSDLTYHLFGSSYEGYPEYDGTTEKIDGAGTTAYYPDGTDTAGMADNDMQHFAPATADRDPGSREYWTTKAELIPYKHVYDAEHPADSIDSGSAEIAVIALEAESGGTRWDHETDHDKGEHVQLNDPAHPFTLVTVIPDKNGVESTVYSPFSSRTQYMTVPLYFGYDGEIAGHLASEGETLATCEHGLTGYALTQDELYDPNIPTTERSDLFGSGRYNTTPEQIAQNTAEFTLKSSEGLLLTGLGKDITYRFTEKLTNTQIEQGCTLKEINHVQGSDISEVDQHDSNGVYSVFGDTDYLTEQTNYINTIDPELFVLTKSMVDINGNKIDVAPDEEFTFTLTFEPADSAAMTDIDDTLHYWKGNKDYQSAVEWTDGDHTYKMPTTAPKLDEYEPYLDGSTYRLKPIEPDGGKWHTYTVHLKANEAIVFYGLIAGTKFTVKETPNKKYPVVPGVGPEDRGYTQTGTIYRASVDSTEIDPETTHNRAEFTNRLETGALTVEKRIKVADPDTKKEFGFTVTLTPAPGTELKPEDLEATKYKADGTAYDASEFTISWNKEGDSQKAEVMLKHGEKVVINGIPLETTYTVDETNRNGYTLKDIETSGNVSVHGKIASGKIEKAEAAMTFVNVPAVFLPEAGGMGILIFCIIGTLLIACATAYIVLNRKKLFNKYRR